MLKCDDLHVKKSKILFLMEITLGSFPTKKEMNISALQRIFVPEVNDYLFSIPECTLFHFNNKTKKWEKLQISGTLFLLCIEGQDNPYLFILNRCSFINPEDFKIEIPPTSQISSHGSQLYLIIDEIHQYCVSSNTEKYPAEFIEKISHFWQGKKYQMKGGNYCSSDPTFRHAMKFGTSVKI